MVFGEMMKYNALPCFLVSVEKAHIACNEPVGGYVKLNSESTVEFPTPTIVMSFANAVDNTVYDIAVPLMELHSLIDGLKEVVEKIK